MLYLSYVVWMYPPVASCMCTYIDWSCLCLKITRITSCGGRDYPVFRERLLPNIIIAEQILGRVQPLKAQLDCVALDDKCGVLF